MPSCSFDDTVFFSVAPSATFKDEVDEIPREPDRNAFAIAVPCHSEVGIHYDQDQLRMRIYDDGKGIDPL